MTRRSLAIITAFAALSACSSPSDPVAVDVATIALSAPSTLIAISESVRLSATLKDQAGDVLVDRSTTWESSDPTVADVTSAGIVTALAQGTTTIRATSQGKSATLSITVYGPPVASVLVTPVFSYLTVKGSRQLTATLRDVNGYPVIGPQVTWSAAGVAFVNATGEVFALAPGNATVTATFQGKSGSTTISVVNQ